MKIEISERTRIELEYLYGKDKRAWAESIEPIIGEIAKIVYLRRNQNTPEEIAPCEHNWLRRKSDGTYRCAVCDKTLEVDEEIPY